MSFVSPFRVPFRFWRPRRSPNQAVLSWSGKTLAYVIARARKGGGFEIHAMGVERQEDRTDEAFAQRLQSIGLKGAQVHCMLRPEQYQILQIEAPAVAPEEMRAAARYQIREMLDAHVDDITLDVLRVGDGRQKGPQHIYVIAAGNEVLKGVLELGEAMGWDLPVIDIQETSQRNLQALAGMGGSGSDRADAALVVSDDGVAVITITSNAELFYTRRIDVPSGLLGNFWRLSTETHRPEPADYMPVDEYVPDYGGDLGGYEQALPSSGEKSQPASGHTSHEPDDAQRFLVEVQRSLDLWDRTWSSIPLARVQVFAGLHGPDLASWLTRELGTPVEPMQVEKAFSGLNQVSDSDWQLCWPLLGGLLRAENRAL